MTTIQTLVLNKNWAPINVIPAWKAVAKVFNERAVFMHYDPPETFAVYTWESWVNEWSDAANLVRVDASRVVPMCGFSLVLPDIIICTEYNGFGYKANARRVPKFNRRNLLIRDRGICQFCGKKFPSSDLTMDHVVPKSKGGTSTWQNVVCACADCNNRKADRTPVQAGMRLIRKPFQPMENDLRLSMTERLRMKIKNRPPKIWDQFLGKGHLTDKAISFMYWNTELKE